MDDSIFNLQYAHSISPLSKAAKSGDLKKLRKLLQKGFQPQSPDNRGWTAIHYCVAENQLKALQLILKIKAEDKKYLVNLTTWENVNPLHVALKTSKPCLEMIKTLLKAGADVKQSTNTNLTPLHLACMKKGSLQLVKLLVEFGADVNVQEDLGLCTPLHVAVCGGCDLDVIKYLLNLSDLSLRNNNDRTAFLEACNCNSIKIVELFLDKDKSLVNVHYGLPPLSYAGVVGNIEMIKMLINSGADVNVRCKAMVSCKSDLDLILFDKENFLPIHSSLMSVDVFKVLLKSTNRNELLRLETTYCSFPLYVLVFGGDDFYEELLQSDLPDELKTITGNVLVRFIHRYSDVVDFVDKIPVVLKYNFNLQPEDILQCFVTELQGVNLCNYCNIMYLLAKMGISPQFQYRNYIMEYDGVMKFGCDLMSQLVSLKQYCRLYVRRWIRSLVKNDWLAMKMLRELGLPDCLTRFVLFESV